MIKRIEISRTHNLPHPNLYVQLMDGEFSQWAFNEERAPLLRGKWRSDSFKKSEEIPMDLEIGTGNGFHFAHRAVKHPERLLVGIELKYKPLVQSIRRALRLGAENARIMRYDASFLADLFAEGELNNVFIHFPDPWERKKQWKHRLIQDEFLELLFKLQRPGSQLEFKTDSQCYFDYARERFLRSRYELMFETRDLHHSEMKDENFITHFESLFLRKGLPIYAARFLRG